MTRRYADPIDVRRGEDAPSQFLWRGRLYLVRDVLGHWVESRPWWVAGAAAPLADAEAEREVWRVEASPGRALGSGVYDLRFDWATGQWALAGVVD